MSGSGASAAALVLDEPLSLWGGLDPATGRIVGWVDVRRLLPEAESKRLDDRGGVANGIAYDSSTAKLLVTGKYWPYVFQIDIGALRFSHTR
jgi:glutamine cyclotransferase